jgi:hypothetical protein
MNEEMENVTVEYNFEIRDVEMEDDFSCPCYSEEEEDDPLGAKFLYQLLKDRITPEDIEIMMNMIDDIIMKDMMERNRPQKDS